MDLHSLLNLKVEPGGELIHGSAYYRSLDRAVEISPASYIPGARTKTLALGKLVLSLEGITQRLVGLRAFTPSNRWKVEDTEPPPAADTQGGVSFTLDFRGQDLCFYNLYPKYEFHAPDNSLRIRVRGSFDLVIRVGDCLLLGMDRAGILTDFWLEGLRFTA
ncbi:MAG: hypothetical protein H5T72_04570 [Actinobacteria bacterium]|nr:hypothetical protein [Actinomycetota bacterium]